MIKTLYYLTSKHDSLQDTLPSCWGESSHRFTLLAFFLRTFTKNEESHSHVDKDPGESEELHQVVHKQVASLQSEEGFTGNRGK